MDTPLIEAQEIVMIRSFLWNYAYKIQPEILPLPEGRPWWPSFGWETLVRRMPESKEEWNYFSKTFEKNKSMIIEHNISFNSCKIG